MPPTGEVTALGPEHTQHWWEEGARPRQMQGGGRRGDEGWGRVCVCAQLCIIYSYVSVCSYVHVLCLSVSMCTVHLYTCVNLCTWGHLCVCVIVPCQGQLM